MRRFSPRSVRTRLALGYAAAVAAALLLYAGVVYAYFERSLSRQLDDRVEDLFEATVDGLVATPDGVRWVGDPVEPEPDPAEPAWVEVALANGATVLRWPATVDPDAGPWRTLARHVRLGGREYTVRAARSERGVRGESRTLLLGMLLGLAPMAGLAYLLGRLLARRALAPVGALTDRARAISAERLSERLPVGNPEDELGRLASVLNASIAGLERSFETLRRFTADASHELRTPLTAMRSVGEVGLREPRDAAAYRDVVGSMLEEADRLTLLVDGLLTLSRADAGRTPIERRPTDLPALCRDVLSHLGVLAEEKEQSLVLEGTLDGPAMVDPTALRRVMTNLVDNAIRHAPSGSRITVSIGADAGDLRLAVRDEGPGIAPEHRDRVFERFYRADAARSGGGSGLGLAIARSAVEAHGGRIELASEVGAGSTFTVVLPRG
ncbi:MAG TPA: ATP-binding protein [Planctomycetota bacterium]|nr:ATP-binding protein [Planctomycetota bacterium]